MHTNDKRKPDEFLLELEDELAAEEFGAQNAIDKIEAVRDLHGDL